MADPGEKPQTSECDGCATRVVPGATKVFPMLGGLLKSAKARANAIRIASAISPVLLASSGLALVADGYRGPISEALLHDEFVLSRFQGAIVRCIEVYGIRDNEAIGHALWKTFDLLFPGHGRSALELCNKRLTEGDKVFKEGVGNGWQEMGIVIDTGGKALLVSIHERILQLERELFGDEQDNGG